MIFALLLLSVTLLDEPIGVLVLRSGHQITVDGRMTVQNGNLVFRDRSGVLYSLPLTEIDQQATLKLHTASAGEPDPSRPAIRRVEPTLKLRVNAEEKQRLLKELEKSRGTPAAPAPRAKALEINETVEIRDHSDEARWRAESRNFEENVRRKQENLEMLRERAQRLEDEVRALLSFGVPPDQYSYSLVRLQDTRSMLDQAQLDLTQAQRDLADFRERARRQGILPGWLR